MTIKFSCYVCPYFLISIPANLISGTKSETSSEETSPLLVAFYYSDMRLRALFFIFAACFALSALESLDFEATSVGRNLKLK